MAPRRKCLFNKELQNEFTFIQATSNANVVMCTKCRATFSIANSGRLDIQQHLKTNKHKSTDVAAATSKKISNFFRGKTLDDAGTVLCINEGTWAYHCVQHNHSFRSNDCTSKLIKNCFDEKYSCGRTKCEAIVCNAFAPNSIKEITNDLNEVNFVTVFSDCSNHGSVKICPVLICYFTPQQGVQVKLLHVDELPGETSDILINYIVNIHTKYDLNQKLLGLCADNTNCNFGGAARRGKNNLFTKLQISTNNTLVGINCAAHILNNCIQTAVECLPIDVEVIIVKIYSFFYIYTVRVEELREICDGLDNEYSKLLGFSKTRWLTLKPAIERILKLFNSLKIYFLSQQKCPTVLKQFFSDSFSEVWLTFVQCQASLFHNYISKIESQKISMLEVASLMKDLKINIINRKKENFMPLAVKTILKDLALEGQIDMNQVEYCISKFYSNCIDYLNQWSNAFDDIYVLKWVLLKEVPYWKVVEESLTYITNKRQDFTVNDNELFDELTCIKNYVTSSKINEWKENSKFAGERWVEIFNHFKDFEIRYENILKIVEFSLCLPGSNAPTERVFSLLNNFWSSDKSRMKVETIKSMLMIKCNYYLSCLDFKKYLQENPSLVKQIHSSEKYTT